MKADWISAIGNLFFKRTVIYTFVTALN